MLDLAVFVSRLKQVIVWTDQLSQKFIKQYDNEGSVFRQFNPIINGQPLYNLDKGYAIWTADDWDVAVYEQVLQAALHYRDSQLIVKTIAPKNFAALGRILCYELRVTTNVGDAVVESDCFIDENDAPPIDTWFFLEKGFPDTGTTTLFCWIPKQYEPLVQVAFNCWDNLIFGSMY
jgi:hypothetical protein